MCLDVDTMPKAIRVLLVLTFVATTCESQEVPNLTPLKGPIVPTVTFTESLWGANPSYYSITVSSMGTTSYWGIPSSDPWTGEPEMEDFTIATRTRNEIFRLTEKLHFLRGKFKTRDENGKTGWKSLTYADGPVENRIDYTFSTNQQIKRLTLLFESIATTMEYGWKLSRLHADDPTGLAAELKQMQTLVSRGPFAEFEAIAPTLQDIAFNPRFPERSRRNARDLLKETDSQRTETALSAAPYFGAHAFLPDEAVGRRRE
jgi:hypothetical protein